MNYILITSEKEVTCERCEELIPAGIEHYHFNFNSEEDAEYIDVCIDCHSELGLEEKVE